MNDEHAMWQSLGLADDGGNAVESLKAMGYGSVFDIARQPPEEFSRRMVTLVLHAEQVHTAAVRRAAQLTTYYRRLRQRQETAQAHARKLDLGTYPPAFKRSLGTEIDFETLFPVEGEFARPGSVESLFSPAAYLSELYGIAVNLHPASHPLNIRHRRPDLDQLILSKQSLNTEISTLQLVLEILERSIGSVVGDACVDFALAIAPYPLTLPYHSGLEKIRTVLKVGKTALPELWRLLYDLELLAFSGEALDVATTPPWIREANLLSPSHWGLLTQAPSDSVTIAYFFGVEQIDELQDTSVFCDRTGLSFDDLVRLTSVDRYYLSEHLQYRSSGGGDKNEVVNAARHGGTYINNFNENAIFSIKDEHGKETLDHADAQHLDRIHRVIRLRHLTGLSFEPLDWLRQKSPTTGSEAAKQSKDPTFYLYALGEYRRLNTKAPLPFDEFAAYVGDLNGYAEKEEQSFFDQIFNDIGIEESPLELPWPFIRFNPKEEDSRNVRQRLCRGLRISDPLLCLLGRRCLPGVNEDGHLDGGLTLQHVSALYRLVAIPRRLGVTILEGLTLWHLLDPSGELGLISTLASLTPTLDNLKVLRRTESVVDWMRQQQLDVASLQLMLVSTFPLTATPELARFLTNIYTSMNPDNEARDDEEPGSKASDEEDLTLVPRLCKHIGARFELKTPSAIGLTRWADAISQTWESYGSTEGPYDLLQFWKDLCEWYQGTGNPSEQTPLRRLETSFPRMIRYAHQLTQLALWQQWAQLTEQDFQFILENPEWLENDATDPLLPCLRLMLILSRFKAWQKSLKAPVEEALRYFAQCQPQHELNPEWPAQELARLHDWDVKQVIGAMRQIYEDNGFPKNFFALYPLTVRMQLCNQLQLGIDDLHCIEQLAESTNEVAIESLIARVASALMATRPRP